MLPEAPLPMLEEMHLPAREAIGTSSTLDLINLSKATVRVAHPPARNLELSIASPFEREKAMEAGAMCQS